MYAYALIFLGYCILRCTFQDIKKTQPVCYGEVDTIRLTRGVDLDNSHSDFVPIRLR